jgi:hypothetical protein
VDSLEDSKTLVAVMAEESEGESPTSFDLGRSRQDLCILQLLEINNFGLVEIEIVVGFTKFAGAEKCRALEAAAAAAAAAAVVDVGAEDRIHVVEAILGLILGTHMAGPHNF